MSRIDVVNQAHRELCGLLNQAGVTPREAEIEYGALCVSFWGGGVAALTDRIDEQAHQAGWITPMLDSGIGGEVACDEDRDLVVVLLNLHLVETETTP